MSKSQASSARVPNDADAASAPQKAAAVDAPSSTPAKAPAANAATATSTDDDANIGSPNTGAVVDMDVFGQLLEIDDDDSHEFSKTLAFDYISQAEATFKQIDEALAKKDLEDLSRKGHFLKGSSSALGLQRVQRSCELMQHFGARKDEKGEGPTLSDEEALKRCTALLVRLRREQEEAKQWLHAFYKASD